MAFRSRKSEHIGNILGNSFPLKRLQGKLGQYKGFSCWEEIAGERFFPVTRPERISQSGVLVVQTIDAAWIQELDLHKLELIERYNSNENTGVINDIRFVPGNPREFKQFQQQRQKQVGE